MNLVTYNYWTKTLIYSVALYVTKKLYIKSLPTRQKCSLEFGINSLKPRETVCAVGNNFRANMNKLRWNLIKANKKRDIYKRNNAMNYANVFTCNLSSGSKSVKQMQEILNREQSLMRYFTGGMVKIDVGPLCKRLGTAFYRPHYRSGSHVTELRHSPQIVKIYSALSTVFSPRLVEEKEFNRFSLSALAI